MREAGRNPNEIIRGTKPVATLTSAGTSLNFDASQISLIPGMQYAFRWQAHDTQGRSLYKNSGYSEVRTFMYGDACLAPTEVTVSEKSTQWVSLTWQPAATATQYVVRYRQANDPDAQWFEDKSYTTTKRISGLRPGNPYEYQVKCLCGSCGSEYSSAQTVATIGAEEANLEVACSPATLPAPILDASTSLPVTIPGSFFKVGHFDMKVTEVTGGAGTFSGKGEIFVPFLAATLKVSFQHIAVNATGQVVAGEVVADVVDERSLSTSTINRINGYQPAATGRRCAHPSQQQCPTHVEGFRATHLCGMGLPGLSSDRRTGRSRILSRHDSSGYAGDRESRPASRRPGNRESPF